MDEEERIRLIKAQLAKKKTKKKSNKVLNAIFLILAGTLIFGACSVGLYYTILYME